MKHAAFSFGFFAIVLMMAGCSSSKPKPDPMILACPERVVSMVQENQHFLSQALVGETSAKGLRNLDGLKRKATLVRGNEDMGVAFYQTGIVGCSMVMAVENMTPVVVKDGKIVAVGSLQLRALTAKGWVLKEAVWPWQRYEFGYIPKN